MFSLLSGIFYSSLCLWNSSMLLHASVVGLFLLSRSILLYSLSCNRTFALSSLGLSCIKLLWTFLPMWSGGCFIVPGTQEFILWFSIKKKQKNSLSLFNMMTISWWHEPAYCTAQFNLPHTPTKQVSQKNCFLWDLSISKQICPHTTLLEDCCCYPHFIHEGMDSGM